MPRDRNVQLPSLPKRKADFIEPMECTLVPSLPEGPQWTDESGRLERRSLLIREQSGQPRKDKNQRAHSAVKPLRPLERKLEFCKVFRLPIQSGTLFLLV